MAVAPLFNDTKDALLKRIRMSTASDTVMEAVDGIIQEVRLAFFSALDKTRALQIAGYSLVDNPESDEEILRVSAATAEANWVAYLIAGRFPMLMLDGTVTVRQDWNDEPLTRDATAITLYRKELKASVDSAIGEMKSPVADNSGSVKATAVGPEDPYLISENFIGLTNGRGI